MGPSYSNLVLRGPERGRIVQALEARGRTAFVGPTVNGCTVVFDEESEHDPQDVAALAAELTAALGGAALGVTLHDDHVLSCSLAQEGRVVDEYDSSPGYFEGNERPPHGGNAALLCDAFGVPERAAEVERILRGDHALETARHEELTQALGLPAYAVNLGYKYVYMGDAMELEDELAHVGELDEERDVTALVRRQMERSMPGDMMAQVQGAAQAMMASMQHPLHAYFRLLAQGDAETLRSYFLGELVIDDPLSGRVEGDEGLVAHVARAYTALAERMLQYMPAGLIESPDRVVTDGTLMLGPFPNVASVPVAVVWERAPEGGYSAIRAYYSLQAFGGAAPARAPLLPADPDLTLADDVAAHLRALAAEDIEALVATMDETCLGQVSMGLQGADALRAQYGARLDAGGGVTLQPCAVADDGQRCALEFAATRWDGDDIPAQAGLAIFARGDGKLCTVSLYGELGPMSGGGFSGLPAGMPDLSGMMGGMLAGLGGGGMLAGLGGGGGMPDLSALLGGGLPDLSALLGGGFGDWEDDEEEDEEPA
jgi:hypothetical protein